MALTRKQLEEMKKLIDADDRKNDDVMRALAETKKLAQAASEAAKKAKAEMKGEAD